MLVDGRYISESISDTLEYRNKFLRAFVDLSRLSRFTEFNMKIVRDGVEVDLVRSGSKTSLADFCEALLNKKLNKGERKSNWSGALTEMQVECEVRAPSKVLYRMGSCSCRCS